MTIIEVTASTDRRSLVSRLLRKNTKDELARQMAKVHEVSLVCKDEHTKRKLDEILDEAMW